MKQGVASLGVMLILAGCVSPGISPEGQAAGLTEQLLFELEAKDWGTPLGRYSWADRAKEMKVPVDARPLAVREASCWRGPRTHNTYKCRYLVDWGRAGEIEGTYKRKTLAGQEENGEWSIGWIVVTGS